MACGGRPAVDMQQQQRGRAAAREAVHTVACYGVLWQHSARHRYSSTGFAQQQQRGTAAAWAACCGVLWPHIARYSHGSMGCGRGGHPPR